MKPIGGKRLKTLPVRILIPNAVTLLALCAGLTSMRFAYEGRWEVSAVAILIAAVLDSLDGALARALKGASKFGAELDSLSDMVSFGVAPAFFLYVWSLHELGRFGWVIALVYGLCCALRLARFNTALEAKTPPTAWGRHYFTGLPAPGAAGLVMLPLYIDFQFESGLTQSVLVVAPLTILISLLMVSRAHTYSFRRLNVRRDYVLPLVLAFVLIGAFLSSYQWGTLTALGITYLATVPIAANDYRNEEKRHASRGQPPPDDSAPPSEG